jgi:uncharacterized protein YciI
MFLNTNPDKEQLSDSLVGKYQKGHRANMGKLSKEGFLLAAGPFHEKGGIFIFDPTKGNLNEKLAGDPSIMNNRFLLEIFEYEPLIGGVCPVGEDYEMVSYQFVRFHPFSGSQVRDKTPLTKEELAEIQKELDIVTYAKFPGGSGAILIYKKEEGSELVSNFEVLKKFEYRIEEKKLYIAKGSFCEK